MAVKKTVGLVLRRYPIRETSIVAVFYSPDVGKFSGILKGIRKDPKKFGSSVDIFTLNEVFFYPSRVSSLHLVSKCDLIRSYIGAVRPEDYKAAGSLMRLVDLVSPIGQTNSALFEMLLSCLELVGRIPRPILSRVFEIKLLDLVGFRPYLDGCVACLKRDIKQAWFSHSQGGLLCQSCKDRDPGATRLSAGMVMSIKTIEKMPLDKAVKVVFSKKDSLLLNGLLEDFLSYHVIPSFKRRFP